MRPEDFTSEEAKAAAAWIETVNPLRGMTATRMQNLYDASRSGDTVHLQWLYQEIEKIDPTLLICQQRRTGALASLDWHISTRNKKRTRGFDETLAQEQADCLELAFGDADQANFNEAVEHLARGFFRGFAHVLPRWSGDGLSIKGFDCLDQWNFVRDLTTGTWYWNPEAHAYTGYADCRPIPRGELVVFCAPYHIDYPAMTIYLRSAVGEQGWSKFVERFGIPPVILTMPQDIPNDQVDVWRHSAEKVAEGGSGAVPAGTGVNFCDGARGINPFKDFIRNQRELIVLMSTGGILTSLAESGSGTLAGGAHSETWAEVRRMDSAKIGSVLNRTIGDTILERAFPGRPKLAYFAFDTEAVPSPGEVFDDAAKARAGGYLIDKADLEERTGYRLVKDEPSGGQMGLQGGFNGPSVGLTNKTPFKTHDTPFKISRSDSDGQGDGSTLQELLGAFSRDLGPAAEEVKKFLEELEKEVGVGERNDPLSHSNSKLQLKAKALVEKLPELMPEDPAMAAVIAEEMARAFGDVVKNKTDAQGNEHGEDNGQFVEKAGDSTIKESPKAKAKREKHEWQVKAAAQADANMARVKSGEDCRDFMPGITISGGKKFDHIAFYQSEYRHINEHVQGDFGGGKVGYNHQAMLEGSKLSHAITQGTWFAHHGDYVAVDGKDKAVVLSPDGKGLKITSTYESTDKVNEIRTGGFQRVFNKEDLDESH